MAAALTITASSKPLEETLPPAQTEEEQLAGNIRQLVFRCIQCVLSLQFRCGRRRNYRHPRRHGHEHDDETGRRRKFELAVFNPKP